jgi:hypothetical protein
MGLTRLTCPKCKSSLKPPKPVPEGSKLKCPRCKANFTASAEVPRLSLDEDESEDIRIPIDDDDGPRLRDPDEEVPVEKVGAGIVETPETPTTPQKKKAADEIDVIDILDDDDSGKKKEKKDKGKEVPKKPPTPEKQPEKKAEKKDEEKDEDSAGTYGVADSGEEKDLEEIVPPGKKGKKGKKKKKGQEKEEVSYNADLGGPPDPRGPAQEEVMICSNYMLLSAIVGFIGWLGVLLLVVIPKAFPVGSDDGTKENPKEVLNIPFSALGAASQGGEAVKGDPRPAEGKGSLFTVGPVDMAAFAYLPIHMYLGIIAVIVLGLAWAGLVAYGAAEAQSLTSRSWGIAASILCMVSYQILGLVILIMWFIQVLLGSVLEMEPSTINYTQIGIMVMFIVAEVAVGAWVLVTLLKDEVKAGYEYKPE